ncbi:uncharacterized protein LOC130815596 [Amaranthus tricolor]|uniref:uncharacterized protein LOC130815596 n=1 Tax=Amaranthus tricolor TaxID=29722 RepID=UPI0025892E72|nr:uncharacterized protein LOC130815596 [Amaranthus tricolor]
MAAFDGTSCPEEHLMAYKNLMLLFTTNPALWCKFFSTTLTGVALTWYTSLPSGSIHKFAQLEGKFLGHFVASKRQEKSNLHLLSITQLEGEPISSYLKKFHEAVLETNAEAMKQCQNYVTASEICQAHDPKKRKSEKKDPLSSNHSSRNREEHSSRKDRNYMPRRLELPSEMEPPRSRHVYVTEGEVRTRNLLDGGNDPMFNLNRRDIFFAIRGELPTLPPTTTPTDRRNYNLWCDYHKEHGHTLAQCRELKRILHQLADEGKLSRFINRKDYDARGEAERRPWNQRHRSPKRDEARRESSNTQGTINMILGGYTEEYPTIRATKDSVHTLLKGPPKTTANGTIMKFDTTTSQPLQQPHTDPLVVTLKIGQMKVKRVLVNTGSTADLITMECLRKMKFEEKHLQPLDKPLIGFGGNQLKISYSSYRVCIDSVLVEVRVECQSVSGCHRLPIFDCQSVRVQFGCSDVSSINLKKKQIFGSDNFRFRFGFSELGPNVRHDIFTEMLSNPNYGNEYLDEREALDAVIRDGNPSQDWLRIDESRSSV